MLAHSGRAMIQLSRHRLIETVPRVCRSCQFKLLRGAARHHSTEKHRDFARVFSRVPSKLPSTPARTRFAPSPTGYLHLGSLRTALFNYLLARRTGGQFILRIEDTDTKRTIPDAEKRLYEDLNWAGLEWDEGPDNGGPFGPYRQSERSELYKKHTHQLLQSGGVYRCFCSTQRLHKLAHERSKLGLNTEYDRTCARLSQEESVERAAKGESFVVRLKVPDTYPEFQDLVYGKIGSNLRPARRPNEGYEDPILLKSDGLPTYHLANVIDDHHMQITHVVRGTEWLQATAKHMVIYKAFGWKPPQFAHVGLLTNEDGQKLSKRNLDLDISHFRDTMGIFPETLTNFAALLGWSHTEKSDFLPLEELEKKFSLKFTKGNTAVSLGKLWFLQSKFALKRAQDGGRGLDAMISSVAEIVEQSPELDSRPDLNEYVKSIILLDAKNFQTASAFVDHNRHFFLKPKVYVPEPEEARLVYKAQSLKDISEAEWSVEVLKKRISAIVSELLLRPDPSSEEPKDKKRETSRSLYAYLRRAVMDGQDGMSVADAMQIIGREESLRRLSGVVEKSQA